MTREEAIKVIESSDLFWFRPTGEERVALDVAIEALSEPKTGEWETDMVYAGIEFYRCDQCDFRQSEKSRYCPNCGARMRGEDGEEE
jgi:rubrerythrin